MVSLTDQFPLYIYSLGRQGTLQYCTGLSLARHCADGQRGHKIDINHCPVTMNIYYHKPKTTTNEHVVKHQWLPVNYSTSRHNTRCRNGKLYCWIDNHIFPVLLTVLQIQENIPNTMVSHYWILTVLGYLTDRQWFQKCAPVVLTRSLQYVYWPSSTLIPSIVVIVASAALAAAQIQ